MHILVSKRKKNFLDQLEIYQRLKEDPVAWIGLFSYLLVV
jgi:hypothetical protein